MEDVCSQPLEANAMIKLRHLLFNEALNGQLILWTVVMTSVTSKDKYMKFTRYPEERVSSKV